MHTENRIVETRWNVTFGMGGPYKLVSKPGREIIVPAWRYAELKAAQRSFEHRKLLLESQNKPTQAEDHRLYLLTDELIFADAEARKAFHSNNHRWSVVVVGGNYVYLCRGMDSDGHKYEPALRTGPMSGIVTCYGCHGFGKTKYGDAIGLVPCLTCQGKGWSKADLPETVRRALEAEMHATLEAKKGTSNEQ